VSSVSACPINKIALKKKEKKKKQCGAFGAKSKMVQFNGVYFIVSLVSVVDRQVKKFLRVKKD